MPLRRNLSDPDSIAFWETAKKAREAVRKWPAWKRGKILDNEVKGEAEPDYERIPGRVCSRCQSSLIYWCRKDGYRTGQCVDCGAGNFYVRTRFERNFLV